jgi:outer membrane lipoprotein SlyB
MSIKWLTLILCLSITGCAGKDLRPTDVSKSDARKLQRTEEATVIDIMSVKLRGETEIAQGIGAASGGYIANRAAKEENEAIQAAATVAGALVGSLVGTVTSDIAMDRSGTSVVLKMDSGQIQTISQQDDSQINFLVGERVWVIYSGNTVRVLPQNN